MRERRLSILVIAFTLFLVGCGQDNMARQNSLVGTNSNVGGSYYIQNGLCMSSTGQVVSYDLCPDTNTNNSSGNTNTNSTDYYMQNGYCYDDTTGSQVSIDYCSHLDYDFYMDGGTCRDADSGQQIPSSFCYGTETERYVEINGGCYDRFTNSPVAYSYCGGSNSNPNAIDCSGFYYYVYYGQYQIVNCSISNCSGATLYTFGGDIVMCK